jgi:hypothetical protein
MNLDDEIGDESLLENPLMGLKISLDSIGIPMFDKLLKPELELPPNSNIMQAHRKLTDHPLAANL